MLLSPGCAISSPVTADDLFGAVFRFPFLAGTVIGCLCVCCSTSRRVLRSAASRRARRWDRAPTISLASFTRGASCCSRNDNVGRIPVSLKRWPPGESAGFQAGRPHGAGAGAWPVPLPPWIPDKSQATLRSDDRCLHVLRGGFKDVGASCWSLGASPDWGFQWLIVRLHSRTCRSRATGDSIPIMSGSIRSGFSLAR